MKAKLLSLSLLLLPLGAVTAFSQDKKPAPASAPSDDPMMMKMKEFATPGPNHKVLDAKVGKWNVEMKVWSEPDSEPVASTGTAESKWIFDGRFVEDTFNGTFLGTPFQGHGFCGYDNIKKKYVSVWLDSAGTGLMSSEGTYDAGSKTFTFTGEGPDVMAGKYVKGRRIEKMIDEDHWVMQGFHPDSSGKEYMCMEIHFRRAN